jgi:hypothetical protein
VGWGLLAGRVAAPRRAALVDDEGGVSSTRVARARKQPCRRGNPSGTDDRQHRAIRGLSVSRDDCNIASALRETELVVPVRSRLNGLRQSTSLPAREPETDSGRATPSRSSHHWWRAMTGVVWPAPVARSGIEVLAFFDMNLTGLW